MNNQIKKAILYLRMVFPIFFIGIGVFCILNIDKIDLDPFMTKLFGYASILYGVFRGIRAVKALRSEDQSGEK
ncbi:MAG: hypothetical protein K2X86_11450 [Cytophagaceae bacterium]|nr:hypothetical protein [Cytophagaceae bacterium]